MVFLSRVWLSVWSGVCSVSTDFLSSNFLHGVPPFPTPQGWAGCLFICRGNSMVEFIALYLALRWFTGSCGFDSRPRLHVIRFYFRCRAAAHGSELPCVLHFGGLGASPQISSACAARTFPHRKPSSRKGKSRAFRQQKTFLSICPSAKPPTFPQEQRITAQERENFPPRQLSRQLLFAGVRAASPRNTQKPRSRAGSKPV